MKPVDPLSEPHSPVSDTGRTQRLRRLFEFLAILLVASVLLMTPSVTGLGHVGAGVSGASPLDLLARSEVHQISERTAASPGGH
jgi:hypothetical protein